ncbi:hypothetical protein [Pseudonocardia alaniniphila]|uniref:Uncharacterized protein n=1 Tax=Pseudonocardia alaniniphila TaxID=75291 RepID=A0ABS9TEQ7_9PSEU|nr:hypothetical protein [Pseudonocardia alaniniphila]MCH6167020.1 hypothetical protein [Pseudonocardia alaniniphila]
MWWLVGQVWLLCAIAFLAGAGVTWLVFVRPAVPLRPTVLPGPTGMAPWSGPAPPPPCPATPPPTEQQEPFRPPADPALAVLDHEREVAGREQELARRRRSIGAAAAAALDGLGVAPASRPSPERPGSDGSACAKDDARADGRAQAGATPQRPRRATTPSEIPPQRAPVEPAPP